MEPRKLTERLAYDSLYSAQQTNSDPELRTTILRESEEHFQELLLALAASSQLLEVGCGCAAQAIIAAAAGARVTAVDISREGIKQAIRDAEKAGCRDRINFAIMDCEHLAFVNACFDAVVDHEAFSSLDIPKAMAEIGRVLRPGGYLLGKESLGHNAMFNLNRRFGVLLGRRTKWAAAHIFRIEDLQSARPMFDEVYYRFFHLSVLAVAPFRRIFSVRTLERVLRCMRSIDKIVLANPITSRLAFKTVFKCRRSTEETPGPCQ